MNNGQEWVERLDGIFKISSPGNRYMAPPPPTKTAHFGRLPQPTGSAAGRLRQASHVRSALEQRVRINSERIWPRAAVRQISVVLNIFRLVHPKAHLDCVVCEGRQVCSEKQYDTGQ